MKSYSFLSFAKDKGKNIDKNIIKNLSVKNSQKFLDHAKKFQKLPNSAVITAATNSVNKKVIFKNCAPFTSCISEINNP